jgi:hypothetical protein
VTLIFIFNLTIHQATAVKFLGVIIDQELTWKNHINSVVKNIIKASALIAKIQHYTNKKYIKCTLLCISLSVSYLWEFQGRI